jgi:hypothetical protein
MRRVMIAVEPRLLADTLVRALQTPDVDVVVTLDSPMVETPAQPYDVAIVMDRLPTGVRADVVLRLAGAAGMTEGSVTTVEGTEAAALRDLSGLLETLNRFLRTN